MNIGSKEYKEIQIIKEDGELIASITDENIIVKDGYEAAYYSGTQKFVPEDSFSKHYGKSDKSRNY